MIKKLTPYYSRNQLLIRLERLALNYVLWNLCEGMNEPGQWCVDYRNGKLVYWPLPDEDMSRIEVIVPTIESITQIHGSGRKTSFLLGKQ